MMNPTTPPATSAMNRYTERLNSLADPVRDPPAAVVTGDERAQADERGHAQRRLTRVPGKQVETDGADRDDAGECKNAPPLVVDQVWDDQVQRDERDQADPLGGGREQSQVVRVVPDHGAAGPGHQPLRTSGVPNKPNGRTSRMTNMMRYGTMSPNSGPRDGMRSGM